MGQRVRIRISPECHIHAQMGDLAREGDGQEGTVWLKMIADGKIALGGDGEIYLVKQFSPLQANTLFESGHVWVIALDAPLGIRSDGKVVTSTEVAASELEPIDD